jgi:hypothetical protein
VDATELHYHQLNTLAFIAVNPTAIILVPRTKVDTPAGGYKFEDQDPRPEQSFRIIEFGLNQTPPILQLTDGSQRQVEFLLLGAHDAQVAVDDHWLAIDGREWQVGEVVRSNQYETRALVVERGK